VVVNPAYQVGAVVEICALGCFTCFGAFGHREVEEEDDSVVMIKTMHAEGVSDVL
jgi:hypothetical protein